MLDFFKKRINIDDISITPLISATIENEQGKKATLEFAPDSRAHGIIMSQSKETNLKYLHQYLKSIVMSTNQREVIVNVISKNSDEFPYVLPSTNVVNLYDTNQVVERLDDLINEMKRRFQFIIAKRDEIVNPFVINRRVTHFVRFEELNYFLNKDDKLPEMLIVIDDLNDVIATSPEIYSKIKYLLMMSRSAGYRILTTTNFVDVDNQDYMRCFVNIGNQVKL